MSKDSLSSHFSELRSRAIYCLIFFIVAFVCIYPFNNFLFDYLVSLISGVSNIELIAIEVASPFLVPLRLTGFLALLVSIPFFLYQALAFMASGLYENEKGIVFSRTILGTILFFLGLIFCSLLVLPNVFNFFQSVGPESINITTDISKFLNFVLTLMLAFGFSFQIPILVNALIRLNIFKKHRLPKVEEFDVTRILSDFNLTSENTLHIVLRNGKTLYPFEYKREDWFPEEAVKQKFDQDVVFVRKEVRMDPEDGNLYTEEEFEDYYGGLEEWDQCKKENKQYIFVVEE